MLGHIPSPFWLALDRADRLPCPEPPTPRDEIRERRRESPAQDQDAKQQEIVSANVAEQPSPSYS